MSRKDTLLGASLSVAVPLCIDEILRSRGKITAEDLERARAFTWELAERGDTLLYRGKTRGETAQLFSRLAKSIAVLAFCPGGVTVFGMHFEANPEGGCS